MELKIVIEIDNEENQLGVILIAFPTFIDNDYDDEFGTVRFEKHLGLEEDVTWNKNLYTDQENHLIELYVSVYSKKIEEAFCNLLREQTIPDDY